MLAPVGLPTFAKPCAPASEVYQALKKLLGERGLSTNVGDEGGFAPSLASNVAAVELLVEAIRAAGYRPGDDVALALDPATHRALRRRPLHPGERRPHPDQRRDGRPLGRLVREVPHRQHRGRAGGGRLGGLGLLTSRLGKHVQLVGDDLLVTNTERLDRAISAQGGERDPRQGQPDRHADRGDRRHPRALDAGWGAVMSHRSGETEDTTIADLAVALGTGQIKSGAPPAANAPPSTTASCASKPSSAPAPATPATACSPRGDSRMGLNRLSEKPPQRISGIPSPDAYAPPSRPPERPGSRRLDAYRQTQFLLGADLDLFADLDDPAARARQGRLPVAAPHPRARRHHGAVVARLRYLQRRHAPGDARLLRVCPAPRAHRAETIAAEEALRAGEMAHAPRVDVQHPQAGRAHKAFEFELGRYFAERGRRQGRRPTQRLPTRGRPGLAPPSARPCCRSLRSRTTSVSPSPSPTSPFTSAGQRSRSAGSSPSPDGRHRWRWTPRASSR